MADTDIVQVIAEARIDARSLSEFVFKPADFMVARRLAPPIHTLDYYISTVANITNKVVADSGAFNTAIVAANGKLDKAIADANNKVGQIEQTVNDAINNTAVEGGVLADTFVTVTKRDSKSVARTQKDVNTDYINIKDYGAKGDGVADDTQAFRDAVSMAAAGSTIFMPQGVYRITGSIKWKTKLSLVGTGVGSSIIKMDGTLFNAIEQIDNRPGTGLNPDGTTFADPLEDCHFTDFEIDATGLTSTAANVGGKGMFILFMRRGLFRNLYIHHTIGTGLGCDFLEDTLIENCNVSYCGKNFPPTGLRIGQSGIGIGTGWKEKENVRVVNCVTNYNGNYGVFFELQDAILQRDFRPTGAAVVNCTSEGNRNGFGNVASGGVTFIGCYAAKNKESGFSLTGTRIGQNLIIGCTSENNTQHGYTLSYHGALDAVANCIAKGNGGTGVNFYTNQNGDELLGGIGGLVTDCLIANNAAEGIKMQASKGALQLSYKISGCTVINSGGNGVTTINTKKITITNNIVHNSSNFGIRIASLDSSASTVEVTNNTVTSSGKDGFSINGIDSESVLALINNNTSLNNGKLEVAERHGLSLRFENGTSVVSGNITGNNDGGSSQSYGIVLDSSTSSEFKLTNNIYKGNATGTYIYKNSAKGKVSGSIGGRDSKPAAISLGESPSTLPTFNEDAMYYMRGNDGDTISVSVDGVRVIRNQEYANFLVPSGSVAVVTYQTTGSIESRRQFLV